MIESVLNSNKDWFIELENTKSGEKITICNYYAATVGGVASNYPIDGNNDWISRESIIQDYIFVKSWTPEEC